MSEPIPINLGFPLGGISKATGFNTQPANTTPSCLNVWPYQWSSGRARGGVRPGLTLAASVAVTGTPLNWVPVSWAGGYGVAVQTSTGVWVGTDANSWIQRITTAPGGTYPFATCAMYYNKLYQASASLSEVRTYNYVSSAGNPVGQGILTADTYDDGSSKGTPPTYCGIVYADAGRLILAGDANDPHRVYWSRVDDPRDFDYTKTDSGAAFATSGSTGKITKPVVGVLAHGNDCLLIGHIDGMTVVIGNMRGGGQIVKTEQEIGPLMQSAWCKTASDHTLLMSREGLYAIPGGCAKSVSAQLVSEQIPNDLVGIDPGVGHTCSLVYDGRYHGVHIYVDRAGTGSAYFFDLKNRAFFPMSSTYGVLKLGVAFPKLATATKSGVLALIGSSAYQFDTASTEEITSHCYFGPIALGSPLTEGILTRFTATLAESSLATVAQYGATCRLHFGQSPQEAYNNPTRTVTLGQWTKQGFNFWQYPRGRGQAAYAEIFGTTSNRWCVEELVGEAYPVAARRRGE